MSPVYEGHNSKIYEPPVIDLENKNNSHTLLIDLTGENKNVLEVGTSTGYVSRILKEKGNTVTGIEIDPEAGKIAEKYCDSVIIGDIEKLDLDEYLEPSSFDVIMFGDVLEHLICPEIVVKKVKKYLRSDGYLVVSLPNICHGDIILNLLQGNFNYTDMGLLDETHLRFFGLKNIIELINKSGYEINILKKVKAPLGTTEQRIGIENIPVSVIDLLKSLPEANIYQYIIKAVLPSDSNTNNVNNYQYLNDLSRKTYQLNEKTFCYVNTGEGFSENQNIMSLFSYTDNKFNVHFDLKKFTNIKSLRWDPVEGKLCSTTLEKIILKDDQNQEYEVPLDEIETNGTLIGFNQYKFETIDPQIKFSCPDKIIQVIIEGNINICSFNDTINSLQKLLDYFKNSKQYLDTVLQNKESEINELNEVVESKEREINELNGIVDIKESEINELNEVVESNEREINELNEIVIEYKKEIIEMEKSLVYQSMKIFNDKFLIIIFPIGTKRRIIYDKTISYLQNSTRQVGKILLRKSEEIWIDIPEDEL